MFIIIIITELQSLLLKPNASANYKLYTMSLDLLVEKHILKNDNTVIAFLLGLQHLGTKIPDVNPDILREALIYSVLPLKLHYHIQIIDYSINKDTLKKLIAEYNATGTVNLTIHNKNILDDFILLMNEHIVFIDIIHMTIDCCGLNLDNLKIILDSLLICSNLKTLNLRGNNFGDEGAVLISEFFATQDRKHSYAFITSKGKTILPEISLLNLLDNNITMVGAQALCDKVSYSLLNAHNTMLIFNSDDTQELDAYYKISLQTWGYRFH